MSYRIISKVSTALLTAALCIGVSATAWADDDAVELQVTPPDDPPPSTPKRKDLLALDRVRVVTLDGNRFSGIAPCIRVWEQEYINAKRGAPTGVRFHFKYKSGGKTTVKHARVALKDFKLLGDHPKFEGYVRLETTVNVTGKPVDGGKGVKTKVKLKKKHDRRKHKKHKNKKRDKRKPRRS